MNKSLEGGVKARVFVVFEKLEDYYDDNDRTLHCIFYDRTLAELCVREREWLNLFIDEEDIY